MNLKISCHNRALALRAICLALLAASLLACQSAQAQSSSELAATYGRGIHAYFNNQTSLADEYFSRVIQAGTTDPRVFYFRAMTRMRSNRQQEAKEDMQIGAAYEARDPGNRHAIGKALERVQGPHRRLLERFRQQARMDRLQQRRQQTRQRYEQLEQREPIVLRREISVPLEQLLEPALDLPSKPGIPAASPLPEIAAPAARVTAPPKAAPAASTKVDEDDPFAEGPSDDDPFGEPEASAPEADPFGEPEPRAEPIEDANPFGEPAEETHPESMEDDPFGEPEPDEEPAQEGDDPFGEPAEEADPTPVEDDPFGESNPEEEEGGPDQEEDDPFGEPAEETDPAPMEDDPFGDPASEDERDETFSEEDDPFGDSEPDEREESVPEEDDPFGEPIEEDDGLFGKTTPKNESTTSQLQQSDRVDAGQMAGILGRVVGSLFPWRSIEIPSFSPMEPGAEVQQVGEVAFGPVDELPTVIQVSAAEPLEEDSELENFFGEATDDSASESADDPFDMGTFDEESEPATNARQGESFESEEVESDIDDPFGDF